MTDPLADALATEDALRAQLGDLIGAKARAAGEAERLSARAQRPDADPALQQLADRHRAQSERLAGEVEEVRASLRAHEAVVETLRADAAGA